MCLGGRQTWVGILAERLTNYRTWDKFPHLHNEDNNIYLTWETMQSTWGYKIGSNVIIIRVLVVTLGDQSRDARKQPASLSSCKAKSRSFPEIV